MPSRAKALSSDPVAQEAAEDFLMLHGSAVGAVLAGFFAAAGASAGVLWGPISILVGGIGVGGRAFDGRLVQPGMGVKRPRGFTESEPIPLAARAPGTTAVAAALVAHAYDGGQRLASILKSGVARARQTGADARAELLSRVRAGGVGALTEARFVRELMRVAGPAQGGLLGAADFDVTKFAIDHPALEQVGDQGTTLTVPWQAEAQDLPEALGHGHAVLAIDVRGVAAALSFRRIHEGLDVPALELELPPLAVPVQRGVPRVAPGSRLAAPAPLAISMEEGGAREVLAFPSAANLAAADGPCLRLERDPASRVVVVG